MWPDHHGQRRIETANTSSYMPGAPHSRHHLGLYDSYMTEPARDLSISAARDHLAEVVSSAAYGGRITYVTRHGQRMAAIVPAEVAEAINAPRMRKT